MKEFANRLIEDFSDKEYAHAYMEEHANTVIAAQIKALREQRNLTQAQLAQLAGMRQERVCALENVDYDAWTVKTLRKLAKAFDVDLHVGFVPFSKSILDVTNLSKKLLEVPSRADDLAHCRRHAVTTDMNGNWKLVDTSYLAQVQMLSAQGPVGAEMGRWHSVSQAQEA